MEVTLSINLISIDPDVRGGRPCITGSGLRVSDIVIATLFHNQDADNIAEAYDISLASVHAALAYYYENKADIDADIRQQIDQTRSLKREWIASGGAPLLP